MVNYLKNKTILKQALLFQDGQEPIYSKIKKLYENIIHYQELYNCIIVSAKPKQRAKILNQELFFKFLNEQVENKSIHSFLDLENYLSPSKNRKESITNQGDSKSYYSKVFHKTLLFKKHYKIAQLFTYNDIDNIQNIDNIVVVENAESFLYIEKNSYNFSYENYIYLGGQANTLTQKFLSNKTLLFFIDFDIVSMNMYEDFTCHKKELFIPYDLEEKYFIANEPNRTLYKKQIKYLRENYGDETSKVINLIKKYHAVIEQEVVQ